jgi:hypothetical protein
MIGARRIAFGLATVGAVLVTGFTAWAADPWALAVAQLANQIEPLTPRGRQVTLAVLDFTEADGTGSEFGRLAAARLTLVLGQNLRLLPIERRALNEYLHQLTLTRSDLLDPDTARRFAHDVGGLELLIVTGLSDLGDRVSLDARVIDIATNQPLGVASVIVPKDAKVRRLLEAGRDTPGGAR